MTDPAPNYNLSARTHLSASGAIIKLELTLDVISIDQFKYLLDRALNTVPPHLSNFQDWFELADLLEGRTEKKGGTDV